MKLQLLVLWIVEVVVTLALPLKKSVDISILRRHTRSTGGNIGCVHMESFPGELQYVADGATPDVCGLYLIGQPDELVQVEFQGFNVQCETGTGNGGLLALFDGWELQGELFPDLSDHPLTMQERYTTYCGSDEPPRVFISSQNVALVQFMIPTAGQGFKVEVKFIPSPKPCNAVAMFEMGELTMKNYGMKRNCTTSIIYPEKIQLLNVDVGVTPERKTVEVEVGLTDKCMNYAGGDYIQLMNGNGLDTSLMSTRGVFCGMESNSDKNVHIVLGCQHSVVRMVSSGEFYNTVTFKYAPPLDEDLHETATVC